MAATNVGSIYYTVEADTDQLLNANKAVDSSIDKTTGNLKQLDTQVTKTSKAVNAGLSSVGRSAGQVGIQIQQLTGQIQGGQNIFQAFAAQAADIGIVLGAPLLGVIVALSAALGGTLAPTLFDTTDSAETLEKVMESLDKVITESSTGVNVLSNEYAKLAKQNKVLAEATAISQLREVQNGLDAITDSVKDSIDGFEGFFGEIKKANFEELSDYVNKAGNSIENMNDNFYAQDGLIFAQKATRELQDQLGVTAEEAINLGLSIQSISSGGGVDAIEELGVKLSEIAKSQGPDTSQAIADLQLKINKLADDSVTLTEKQKILQDVLNGVSVASEEQADTTENLSKKYELMAKSMKAQADTLGLSKSKALEYTKTLTLQEAAAAGVNQETISSIGSSYDRQIAFAKETEATKAQTDADKKAAKAKKEAIKADQEAFEAMDALREADKKRKAEQANVVSAVGGASDAMGLGIDTESRLQELQALHDAELISEQEFNAQKLSIMQNYNQQVMALNEERFRQESEGNAFVMDSLDALGNASTNVFSGMLSGTMSATDAVRAFGNAIMNEAINALVQMGIQQLKNQIIGKSVAAANVATAAASGAAMAAAYAPAATAAAIATQGGAVTAGMSAVSTATPIMNTILATGRQYGGPVSSNGMYRINENGAPEVFNAANGQQYMLPNTRGEVVSNKDASGGGTTNIIVNVSSDGSVSTNGSGQMAQFGKEIGQMVEVKYKQMEAQSMRQGGSLWRAQQKG